MKKLLRMLGIIALAASLTGCVVYEEDMDDDDYEIEYGEEDDEDEIFDD